MACEAVENEPKAATLSWDQQVTNVKENTVGIFKYYAGSMVRDLSHDLARFEETVGANPNYTDMHQILPWTVYKAMGGGTPLHWAVKMEDTTMVDQILATNTVDFNACDEYGKATALHYAVWLGNMDIVGSMLTGPLDLGTLNVDAKDKDGNPALVLAAKFGSLEIVKLMFARHLESGKLDVNAVGEWRDTVLHKAVEYPGVEMLTFLIDKHLDSGLKLDFNAKGQLGKTILEKAIEYGEIEMVTLLIDKHLDSGLKLNFTVKDNFGDTVLHKAVKLGRIEMVTLLIDKYLHSELKLDVNAVTYVWRESALHYAVCQKKENIGLVRQLLRCDRTMRLSEENRYGETAFQMAHQRGFKDISKILMNYEPVQRYVEELYRDRQVYVDAANAILVGAALIASVTFGSWLQPPLGLTLDHADVQHNTGLGVFWIFNSFSFYFAIATVVFGARSVLPRKRYFIKQMVEKLRKNLMITAVLLACSVFFVIIAFGIAGCIVLTPILKYQSYMIVPTIIGGLVCLISLGFLSWSLWEDSFERVSIE